MSTVQENQAPRNGQSQASPKAATLAPPVGTVDAYIRELSPHQARSLSGIALRAFLLGLVFTASLTTSILLAFPARQYPGFQPGRNPLWRLPFFLAALSVFHFLEFYTTALTNTRFATISAFLLSQNGSAYNVAHLTAMGECVLTAFFAPAWQRKGSSMGFSVGFGLMILGQCVRSGAMLTAGTSFNHTVQTRRAATHKLVTTGIYSVLRHPSYFGFFWWAVGTQIAIGNRVCLVGYVVVLWMFFRKRVQKEEELLVNFFGQKYVTYKKGTWVGIPFVGGQVI